MWLSKGFTKRKRKYLSSDPWKESSFLLTTTFYFHFKMEDKCEIQSNKHVETENKVNN